MKAASRVRAALENKLRGDPTGADVSSRRTAILERFAGAGIVVPTPLALLLQWLREFEADLECGLLWGSYTKGSESESTLTRCRTPGSEDRSLVMGPSDLDALVVVRVSRPRPRRIGAYSVLDERLQQVEDVEIDLFRDVFVVTSDGLSEYLERLEERHLACFLTAYFDDGVMLRTSPRVAQIMHRLAAGLDYASLSARVVRERRATWSRLLGAE